MPGRIAFRSRSKRRVNRASPAREPPEGADGLHEIKWNGYRMMFRRDGSGARLFTRRGYDWTDPFPVIASARMHWRSSLLR